MAPSLSWKPGIEGLVHVSEMSWMKSNTPPAKLVSISQEVNAVILEVDTQKRRISLGMKQCEDNPWMKLLPPSIIRLAQKCRV